MSGPFLQSVYEDGPSDRVLRELYALLRERTPEESISHRQMPNWEDHIAFVERKPYLAWYLILSGMESDFFEGRFSKMTIVGACYLSKQREIGVSIFERHRHHGHASAAVKQLMARHPCRFLANINPANQASISLFLKLGFGGPIQITLEKP